MVKSAVPMYAIIQTGGKQYRVRKGDVVRIELLDAAGGGEVEFPEVFLVGNGREVAIGRPTVPGARVRATVLGAERLPKVLVFKHKKTKQYKRTIGHRQHVLAIRIDDIDSGGTVMPLEPEAAAARTAAARRKTPAKARAKGKPKARAAAAKGGASRARRTAASAGKAAPAAGGAKPAGGATKARSPKPGGRKPAGGGSGRKRPSGGR